MSNEIATGRVFRRSLPSGASSVLSSCVGCGDVVVLTLSADSKTSPGGVWDPRKGAVATYAQGLTLPAGLPEMGGSCPGATEACRGCYAKAIERYDAVSNLARRNLDALRHVESCAGANGLFRVFVDVLDHVAEYQRRDGLPRVTFRWSAGGDVFSLPMARAIASAHRVRPDVLGWIYTRTLGAVRFLANGGANLRVFVSVDEYNVRAGARVAGRWGVPVAILADDADDAQRLRAVVDEIAPNIAPGRVCPASGGKWSTDGIAPAHIVGVDGRRSSAVRGGLIRGACDACGLCLPGGLKSSVTFLRHGGARDNFPGVVLPGVPVRIGGVS